MNKAIPTADVTFEVGTTLKGNVATTKKLLDDLVQPALASLGLTSGEADVLTLLLISPERPIRPKQLADWLTITTAGMAGRLNSLDRKRLIDRTPSADDGRAMSVELTPEGAKFAKTVMKLKNDAWSAPVVAALGQKQAAQLNALLEKLNAALVAAAEPQE